MNEPALHFVPPSDNSRGWQYIVVPGSLSTFHADMYVGNHQPGLSIALANSSGKDVVLLEAGTPKSAGQRHSSPGPLSLPRTTTGLLHQLLGNIPGFRAFCTLLKFNPPAQCVIGEFGKVIMRGA